MDKAKQYNKEKFRLSLFSMAFGFIYFALFFFLGFSKGIAYYTASLSNIYILSLSIYLMIFFVIDEIVTFPISYYSGFYLEHKYEMSNQKLSAYLWDVVKGFVLKIVFSLIIINIIYLTMRSFPERWWIYASIVMLFFFVVLTKLVPVLIIPIFYKLEELDSPSLLNRLKSLCGENNINLLGIYKMDLSQKTKAGNAAFAGMGSTKRIILGDTMLDHYSEDEIEAVIAHEVAHSVNHDQLKMIFIQSVTIVLILFSIHFVLNKSLSFLGLSSVYDYSGLPVLILVSSFISVLFMPVMNYLIRTMEYAADKKAVELSGKAKELASALTKLTEQNLGEIEPHPVKEFLFHSHPSVAKRVKRLLS